VRGAAPRAARARREARRSYFDPLLLAKIANMSVRARHVVEGLLSGMHKSPYRGHSAEFAEHLDDVPGTHRHVGDLGENQGVEIAAADFPAGAGGARRGASHASFPSSFTSSSSCRTTSSDVIPSASALKLVRMR